MNAIIKDKCYSAREAVQFVAYMQNAAEMREFIEKDMKSDNILKAKVIQRNKQKRYFVLGIDLLRALPLLTG